MHLGKDDMPRRILNQSDGYEEVWIRTMKPVRINVYVWPMCNSVQRGKDSYSKWFQHVLKPGQYLSPSMTI
jgi:hypothetical protein